jgi:metallo-beta-lactamase class B
MDNVMGSKLPQALLAGLMLLAASAAPAQQAPASASPAESDAMYAHIKKAERAARDDLKYDFYHRCFVDPNYGPTIAKQRKMYAPMDPVQVFDQLYFIGQNGVSSWALKTSQGFIIFDTLDNPEEAKQFIEGGMVKLGLDPKQIKYFVITHEHGDHYGGARYLKEQYPEAHLMASAIAWKNMAAGNSGRGLAAEQSVQGKPVPAHDIDVKDGEKFTLGDTTLTFYVTPGHTDGTLSTLFRVTDHGVPHMVGFFGGLGSPQTEAHRNMIIASFKRWQGITAAAGVDTLVSNHQGQDHSVEKLELLKVRHPSDPNPYVIGKNAYQRYFTVQMECTYANLYRHGGKSESTSD